MNAEIVGALQRDDLLQQVNRAQRRRAQRDDHRADAAGLQISAQVIHIQPPARIAAQLDVFSAQHFAHPPVRVMRLSGKGDGFLRMQRTRDPESFQIG